MQYLYFVIQNATRLNRLSKQKLLDKVKENHSMIYSCRNCEREGSTVPMIIAPTPKLVIKESIACR